VVGAREPGELDEARELLAALAKLRARAAVPALLRSVEDLRLRPFVAEALGEIGDARARPALLGAFATERYVDVRSREARALLLLRARDGFLAPLVRFAGVPEPMLDALPIARDAGLLAPALGGWSAPKGAPAPGHVDVEVSVGGGGPARLLVVLGDAGSDAGAPAGSDAGLAEETMTARVDGAPVTLRRKGAVWVAELDAVGPRARLALDAPLGVSALLLVRRAEEIPPPPPRQWQQEDGADGGL
jgi:hypothetical protein